MAMLLKVDAYDIGGKTKHARFLADRAGRFWPEDGANFQMTKVVTPDKVKASDFMTRLVGALREKRMWDRKADLHAFDVCGPMYNDTCLRLVNRGVLEKFKVGYDVAINDAMAALLGSLVAGVAKGHKGAAVYGTLGTGFGGAMRVWLSGDDWCQKLAFYDVEMHFAIPNAGTRKVCNCQLGDCAEVLVKEQALADLLGEQGVVLQSLTKPGKPVFDVGRDIEYQLKRGTDCEWVKEIKAALTIWHRRLAQVCANILGNHVVGGDTERPPALFIFGGGLSCLVDPDVVREFVLGLSNGAPQNGTNFTVCREQKLGNRAGVIGAAAAALMKHLKCGIDDLTYLPDGLRKKKRKK